MSEYFELTFEQVDRFRQCYWYMNAAQRAGAEHAAAHTPGMDFNYVVKCLGAVGAIVRDNKKFNKCAVAKGLVRAQLSPTGAARAYFENGTVKESGDLPQDPFWVYRLD